MIARVLAVARKELASFLQTPIGPVLLFVFTLLAGWWFFFLQRFFVRGEASLQGLYGAVSVLLLVFAPAVTMRLWAEERRGGTYEVLMTLPVQAHEWVLGKFFAAVAVLALWLASLLPVLAVVAFFGDPDPGPTAGGLLGCLLLGSCYLALGCCVSAVTENQIIALIGSVAVSLFFHLLHHDMVRTLFPGFLGLFLNEASLETHFQSIRRGVLDSRDLLFFVLFAAFFLYANTKLVQRRRPHPANVVLAAVAVLLALGLGRDPVWRADLTKDERYTLGVPTEELLDRVDPATPVVLTAYFSHDLPATAQPALRDTEDLLHEFAAHAPDKVVLRILDPSKSEEVRLEAVEQGARPVRLEVGGASSVEVKAVYLALLVECAEQRSLLEQVPLLSTAQLEYELAQRIARLTRIEPLSIGFQQCDRPGLAGSMRARDLHTIGGDYKSVASAVGQHYDTEVVDLSAPVADSVRVLVLPNDHKLNLLETYHLDQFVMRGGSLFVLSSGTERAAVGTSTGKEWVRAPVESKAAPLYASWSFQISPDVVMDAERHDVEFLRGLGGPRGVPQPAIPSVFPGSSASHPAWAGVSKLRLPYPSSIGVLAHPEIEARPLLETSDRALHDQSPSLLLDPEGPGSVPDLVEHAADYDQRFALGVWLEGRFRSPFSAGGELPDELWAATGLDRSKNSVEELREKLGFQDQSPLGTKMLVVGCSDLVTDFTLSVREDNLVFFLNALDLLAGAEDLSSLRAKRFVTREFLPPGEEQKSVALFLGTFLVPILWISVGLVVYWAHRFLRPARARARRAGSGAA